MIASKLRQLRLAMTTGRATVAYPLAPHPAESGYRGRVVVETEHCVGCAGCADACPSRCILVTDVSRSWRVIRRYVERCIGCGRCEDACGYDAVHLVPDYELSTPARGDLLIEQRIFMGVCDRCGRCFEPLHPLDRTHPPGPRTDEPALLGGAEDPWKR
jgi:hydrogenase-4 component H